MTPEEEIARQADLMKDALEVEGFLDDLEFKLLKETS
jgi:hypothetical protein